MKHEFSEVWQARYMLLVMPVETSHTGSPYSGFRLNDGVASVGGIMTISKILPRGFSFNEVVIAILLIGTAIVPVFHIFSRSAAGTIQTQDEVLAHNYAEELLDFVFTLPKDSPLLVPAPELVPVDSARLTLKTTGGDLPLVTNPKFVRFLSVREPDNPMKWPYEYKLLVAEIRWKSPSGAPMKVRMSAYKLL